MPYIRQDQRQRLDEWIPPYGEFADESGEIDPGRINYFFSTIIKNLAYKRESYRNYNTLVGTLECVKAELYRRMISSYEDKKIEENGDI